MGSQMVYITIRKFLSISSFLKYNFVCLFWFFYHEKSVELCQKFFLYQLRSHFFFFILLK